MPAPAFALAPALCLRPNTLSRARRASRASISIRATSEVRGVAETPAPPPASRSPAEGAMLCTILAAAATLPLHPRSQESVVDKAKGALNNAKDAVR